MAFRVSKRQSSFADRANVPRQNVKHVHVNSVKLQQQGSSNKKTLSTNQQKGKSENYDKVLEDKFRQMLQGNMDNLPNLPRAVVRIFISSTFSDMRAERNILSHEVFPKLKQLCFSRDLDFQVVDMRWGVTEDSQNDHSVEKICLQEVENCQKLSLGPNFVAIIGDRYGFRPIPTEISEDDFKVILSYVKDSDLKLLNTWYKLDENCKPQQYILQPISSQFSFFADFSPGCDEHRAKHTKEWNTTLTNLQRVLRNAAQEAFHSRKLTEAQLHEYFYSVTEIEIQKGILSSDDPESQTAVFCREITGFVNFEDALTMRFVDTIREDGKNDVNSEVQKLQNELKKKLKTKLRGMHTYKVGWNSQGINPEICPGHKDYLKEFCKDFYKDFSQMIDIALDKRKSQIRRREFRSQFPDILHHLHFCEAKCRTFCGQEIILNTVKNYILNTSMNKPFVVHAPSGNGKTSVMAMIMKNLRSWLKGNFVGAIRFLGTSGFCLNIYDVLVSLVKQLSDVSGIMAEPIGYKKMKNLQEYFPRFIRRVANSLKKPVIILLDSMDQLSGEYNAHNMQWLPVTLPQNIKIIISTLPNEYGILDSMKALLPDSNYYLEISDLPLQTGKEMMEKYLSLQNRSLTNTQEKVLMNAFLKCPSPLFLKLSVDEAMKWKSYTEQHHLILQETVQGAINKLFFNLEVKFGHILTGHALGYITIARDGVSENELEDVLSCDDEALNDVYRYHNPPVAGIVRIPPVLVARIKYDIREYIVERLSHDKYTMNWYHRQFTETAKAKYTSGTKGEVLHRNLAEIFMCETSVKRDITLIRRKLTISSADRQVTRQPVSEENRRMLFCLPYHIINAKTSLSLQTAKDKCFCNFDFIHNKLAAFSADVFVSELNEFLQFQEDQELKRLRDFVVSLTNNVSSPKRLAISFLEYISFDTADISLKKLLGKAEEFLRNQTTSTLIPLHPGQAPRKDSSAAIISSFTGVDSIISYGQGTVLVKDCMSQNEDVTNSSYKVYFENAEELIDVDVPFVLGEEHQPIVVCDGNYVIYATQSSVTCIDLIEKTKTERQFQTLCRGSSKQEMICKRISTDTICLAVLFENGDIIQLKISNLKEINKWTLGNKTADVVDIFCTETEHLLVLVATHANNGSELQVYSKETKDPKRYFFNFQFCNKCWGLSKAGWLFSALENKGETCTIASVDFTKGETRTPIEIQDRLQYISLSESTPLGCGWSDNHNVVVVFDLERRKTLFRVKVSNPVTCAKLSGGSSVLVLGGDDGNISLYDTVTGNPCASVKAHEGKVQQLVMLDDLLISHGENKMLVWSFNSLLESLPKTQEKKYVSSSKRLLDQISVSSIVLHFEDDKFITIDINGVLKVWRIDGGSFVKEFTTDMKPKKILCSKELCCILSEAGELGVFNLQSSKRVDFDLPKDVLDILIGTNLMTLYTLGMKGKYLVVSILDLRQKTMRKSFPLQSIIQFESLDICLSQSERYLCMQLKVTPEELEDIRISSEKRSYQPQDHLHEFIAVDLQQETGGLMPCVRNFSPVPHLGEVICPHTGNSMIINKRDWVIFWDIPTGKCRRRAKDKEQSANRSNWFENFKDFKGQSKALAQSKDGRTMALGMRNGYVFLFEVTTAYPIGEKLPITKHAAPVTKVVFSTDGRWLASACQNNKIKLWNCSTASEIFSTKAQGEVQEMIFSKDSRHLVILTGKQFSRVLLYRIHTGDNVKVDK